MHFLRAGILIDSSFPAPRMLSGRIVNKCLKNE